MKKEDIDKKIGMPDVDAEWARFEREVIAKDAKRNSWHLAAWAGGIGIAAAIALLFVLNMGRGESADQPLVAQETEEQSPVAQPMEKQPLVAQLTEEQPQTSILRSSSARLLPEGRKNPQTSHPQPQTSTLQPQTPQPSNVYDCGEISARFPGGDKALRAFIDSLFVCPELAIDYGAKGRVIVTFIVDTLGQTSDFRVVRNRFACDSILMTSMTSEAKEQLHQQLSEQLAEEATRVLSQMPRWTPAEAAGKIISQRWTVPVIFNGQEVLQRRIAGLTIVPVSADLGQGQVMRLGEAQRHVSGIVIDENDRPLADAWVGMSNDAWPGTFTDSTGHFSFWLPRSVTKLRVKCVGFQSIIRNIQPTDTTFVFRMKDMTKIREVKVQSKKELKE